MLRSKKHRYECNAGCCREWRSKKCGTYRQREKRSWRKETA